MSKLLRIAAALALLFFACEAFPDDFTRVLAGRLDKVVFAYRWIAHGKELICVLSRPRNYKYGSDVESENVQHFVVYDGSSETPRPIYKEDISAGILSVESTDDRFEITVIGGSANHVKRYTYVDSKVVSSFR